MKTNIRPYLQNELFEGIVSRKEYLTLFDNNLINKDNTVLISISDPDNNSHSADKVSGFDEVIQVKFWDITQDTNENKIISTDTSKMIRDFIDRNVKLQKTFLVHCEAGMSRSAGVGMAIECINNYQGYVYTYFTSTSDIKNHGRYHPNLTVFDSIVSVK